MGSEGVDAWSCAIHASGALLRAIDADASSGISRWLHPTCATVLVCAPTSQYVVVVCAHLLRHLFHELTRCAHDRDVYTDYDGGALRWYPGTNHRSENPGKPWYQKPDTTTYG